MKRDVATGKLQRIVQTLASTEMPIRVRELYVFGSYARGALQCGDLDLVVVTDRPTRDDDARCTCRMWMNFPDYGKAFRKLLKSARSERVQIILAHGTLDDGIKGMKFTPQDCVLIWNGDDRWQDRIAAISAAPKAGRAARRTFIFDGHGFGHDLEEDLIWADEGIKSAAVELTRLPTIDFAGRAWPKIERRREVGMINDAMAEVSNIACTYIVGQGRQPDFDWFGYHWLLHSTDHGIRFYLGKPRIGYIRDWLCDKSVEQACALTFLHQRRENYLWVLRRGAQFWEFVKTKDRFLDV